MVKLETLAPLNLRRQSDAKKWIFEKYVTPFKEIYVKR
jgi:hypothetical protein